VDDSTARASLGDGAAAVTLDFHFGADGKVAAVFTEARSRDEGGTLVPRPWGGTFRHYEEWGGMQIPGEGEVAWHLKEGPEPYWRGVIEDAAYETAAAIAAQGPAERGALP
jgi:hypothetical protein